MTTPELTIRQVSDRSGVAPSAIRFYEEKGLVFSRRLSSGHRRFQRSVLRRIAFIVFAQKVGFTLDEIARELDRLPKGRTPTARDWSRLSTGWMERIDQRMEELGRLRTELGRCIGCGCLSVAACRLSNPADRSAGLGPGPRVWLGLPTTAKEAGS